MVAMRSVLEILTFRRLDGRLSAMAWYPYTRNG